MLPLPRFWPRHTRATSPSTSGRAPRGDWSRPSPTPSPRVRTTSWERPLPSTTPETPSWWAVATHWQPPTLRAVSSPAPAPPGLSNRALPRSDRQPPSPRTATRWPSATPPTTKSQCTPALAPRGVSRPPSPRSMPTRWPCRLTATPWPSVTPLATRPRGASRSTPAQELTGMFSRPSPTAQARLVTVWAPPWPSQTTATPSPWVLRPTTSPRSPIRARSWSTPDRAPVGLKPTVSPIRPEPPLTASASRCRSTGPETASWWAPRRTTSE